MRCVFINRWEPGKYKEVSERYFALLDGKAPEDVLEADKKIKWITREFPSIYGQNCTVFVAEADETSIATWERYFADLMTPEFMPSIPFEDLQKFGPKK